MKALILIVLVLGSINAKCQKKIIADKFGEFYNGVGYYINNDFCNLIDTNGDKLNIPKFECPYSFPTFKNTENVITIWSNEHNVKYYKIDGTLIKEYKNIISYTEFNDGIAVIVTSKRPFKKTINGWGSPNSLYNLQFINISGKSVFTKEVLDINRLPKFHNGVALLKDAKNKFQVINKQGKSIFELDNKIQSIDEVFQEGFSTIKLVEDNKWAFIDTTGKIYNEVLFSNQPDYFSNNLALIQNTNNQFGFMDKNGKIIIEPKYIKAFPFTSEYTTVILNDYNSFQVIDKNGNIVNSIKEFILVSGVENGLIKIRTSDRFGYINIKGEIIIETQYRKLSDFNSNRAYFEDYGGKSIGYLNKSGQVIIIKTKSEY